MEFLLIVVGLGMGFYMTKVKVAAVDVASYYGALLQVTLMLLIAKTATGAVIAILVGVALYFAYLLAGIITGLIDVSGGAFVMLLCCFVVDEVAIAYLRLCYIYRAVVQVMAKPVLAVAIVVTVAVAFYVGDLCRCGALTVLRAWRRWSV